MVLRFWTVVVLTMLFAAAPVWAAPVTVQLRVEGSTATIFEGPVTTDAKTIDKGTGPHPCDGTNGGVNPTPAATMTSALDDGSIAGGFRWDGTWDDGFQDFFLNAIGSDRNDFSAGKSWGYARNFQAVNIGGCQQQVQGGDEVLFAYDFFAGAPDYAPRRLLRLTGPAVVRPRQPTTVTVTDGKDGSPVGGASVDGVLTGTGGTATVAFDSPGLEHLKAEAPDSIRSNALDVCVSQIGAGDCGATAGQLGPPGAVRPPARDSKAPAARISGPRNGTVYQRGPRLLRGTASDGESGLAVVKLALRRHVKGSNCRWWSGRRERFVGSHCHKTFFFAIGDDADWSYLLPRPLPAGHYVLDVKAFDRVRNRDQSFERGRNRVVFDVLGAGGRAG
jgi:hypothetical protein